MVMKKAIFTCVVLAMTISLNAQTIFGKWENRDADTGEIDSIIEVYKKGGKAYAKIVQVTDPTKQDAVCDKCTGKNKNVKIVGMDILTGLSKDGDEWSGGTIVDARDGKEYKCFIKLVNKNKLKIRGYIGFSLFGKTVHWYRNT